MEIHFENSRLYRTLLSIISFTLFLTQHRKLANQIEIRESRRKKEAKALKLFKLYEAQGSFPTDALRTAAKNFYIQSY